jgi:1,4-alpha-glucan branching enzyme
MPRRYFSFFLHAHLPWVLGHGRWPHGVEWVCEACLGSYIPLVRALRRLSARGVRGGVTLSVSPVLAEQLANARFGPILREYVEERGRTAGDDARRFARAGRDELAELARRWRAFYEDTLRAFFEELGGDLPRALADLEARGAVEMATCAATHGYLPLLGRDETIALQLELARRVHERRFGRVPEGLWLPEMAYRPAGPWRPPVGDAPPRERVGIERLVGLAGFRWVPVDTALLRGGRSVGAWSDLLAAPPGAPGRRRAPADAARTADAPDTRRSYHIASDDPARSTGCFVRDGATSLQVWSGETGYPGDGAYLEFHKKSDSGGHRYWRVTGPRVPLGDKEPYRPEEAAARVGGHASHFRSLVTSVLEGSAEGAIVVAPYDAELFGHWWFEGIAWLENVLSQLHADPRVELTTLGRHWREVPPDGAVALPEGSWGNGGGHDVWRNPRVNWTWELSLPAERDFWELETRAASSGDEETRTVLRAAARQLMLLVASDWAFLMTTEGATDYAAERVRGHADDFARLLDVARRLLRGGELRDEDRELLRTVGERDDLFPEIGDAIEAALRDARAATR